MRWAGDNGDPNNLLTAQFSCAAVKSAANFARRCNQGLDRLITVLAHVGAIFSTESANGCQSSQVEIGQEQVLK
ncbi:hypothetical protein ALP97_200324 [Pseudomonas salomonii]|uniref:Uncharacterized protein n=2 Tax=Pseudomonas TaxID=286 RepID=A0A0W0HFG8_PSEFL|nr:hypothetical protein AO063_03235 [Pseudomonas fluorescens ICMP 11288]RMQ89565.1 hypothetical protein ALP97_200324 [Pseudomonas salomonii]